MFYTHTQNQSVINFNQNKTIYSDGIGTAAFIADSIDIYKAKEIKRTS